MEAGKGAAKNRQITSPETNPKRHIVEQWFGFSPNQEFSHPINPTENVLRQLGAGHIVVDTLTNETDSNHESSQINQFTQKNGQGCYIQPPLV